MFARKMTSSTFKHTSLNPPPDVERETIDYFHKTMTDADEILIQKRLFTPEPNFWRQVTISFLDYHNIALLMGLTSTLSSDASSLRWNRLQRECDWRAERSMFERDARGHVHHVSFDEQVPSQTHLPSLRGLYYYPSSGHYGKPARFCNHAF